MRNLHQEVTDRIVAELERGTLPWVQPWSRTPGLNWPCNAVSGRPYSGVNVVLLWLTRNMGWPTPRLLTFKQASEAGCHVRKGERGTRVCFTKDLTFAADTDNEGDERHVRTLKQYVVFNVAQCDDLPEKIIRPPAGQHRDGRNLTIEEFVIAIGVDIGEGFDRAGYSFEGDHIVLPPFATFKSATDYYASLFHEVGHWVGHKSRLNRDLGERFNVPDQRYAAEELIAELTNAFLCAEFDLDGYSTHAAYIALWIKLLKEDSKAIFTAASKASEAIAYLRDLVLAAPAQAAE
jgi:antirestriction protein ArdC